MGASGPHLLVKRRKEDVKDALPVDAGLTKGKRHPAGRAARRPLVPSKGLEPAGEKLEREGRF